MTTELPSQIGLAAAASYFIQYLKNSPRFAWIGGNTTVLNRVLAIVTSFAAAVGVHYSWTHGAEPGTYVITLTGLTMASVGQYAWTWFTQYAIQQGYFRAVVAQATTVSTVSGTGTGAAVVAVPPAAANAVVEKKP